MDAERDRPDDSDRAAAPWHRRRRWRAAIAAGVLVVLMLFVQQLAFPLYTNEGEAMQPTLDSGQRFVANRFADPGVGDVVVFDSPSSAGGFRLLVKRVVAVGGDTIASVDCRLVRNGKPVEEPYQTIDEPCVGDFAEVTVPEGTLFVIGDNRPASSDRRMFGPVAVDDVNAVLWFPL